MISLYNEDVTFDFEAHLKVSRPAEEKFKAKRDPKQGTIVCSHWLVGLCQSQESGDCGFLHRLDRSKMPKCKYGKACKIKNCLLAHVEDTEQPECPFFKQGFCMRGPYCKNRHVKLGPEDCPEIANFDTPVGAAAAAAAAGGSAQPVKKARKVIMGEDGKAFELYKVSLCRYWSEHGCCPFKENCNYAHGEAELREFKGARSRNQTQQANAEPTMDYYTGQATGFMFIIEPGMVPEMYHKRILGLPAHLRDVASRGIAKNAPLFAYDPVNKNIFGLFSAQSPVSDNMDRNLYASTGSQSYPVQVRFGIILDAAPVSTLDPELIMMFGPSKQPTAGPLSMVDTKFLANIFAKRCGAMPTASARSGGEVAVSSADGNTSMYRPPFPFVEIVPVNIPFTFQSLSDLKRRLIGQTNERIFLLVKELGGQNRIRLRMRGIGSGYKEGTLQQELQEPLHFNVSADTESLLQRAVSRMTEHVESVRADMLRQ